MFKQRLERGNRVSHVGLGRVWGTQSGKRASKLTASLCKGSAVGAHLAGLRNGKKAHVAWWDERGESAGDEVIEVTGVGMV